MEQERNAGILQPLSPNGAWQLYAASVGGQHVALEMACTLKFVGMLNGVACFDPDAMYVWQEKE